MAANLVLQDMELDLEDTNDIYRLMGRRRVKKKNVLEVLDDEYAPAIVEIKESPLLRESHLKERVNDVLQRYEQDGFHMLLLPERNDMFRLFLYAVYYDAQDKMGLDDETRVEFERLLVDSLPHASKFGLAPPHKKKTMPDEWKVDVPKDLKKLIAKESANVK